MRKQIPILVGEVTGDVVTGQDTVLEGYDTSIRYHNGYFEVLKGGVELTGKAEFVKRPGISSTTLGAPLVLGTNPRIIGGYINRDDDVSYYLWTYESGATFGVQVSLNTVVAGTPAGWENTSKADIIPVDPTTTGYSAFVYGATSGGLVTTGAVFTRITDVDYPGTTNPGEVQSAEYMDGYVFVAQGQRIWNCDLNAPANWTATSYITATAYPGDIYKLLRMRNYLVAFKKTGIEFFENQGNPTPGSPLGTVRQLNKTVGAYSPRFIQRVADGVIFLGQSSSGSLSFFKLRESDFEVVKVGDQYVDSLVSVGTNLSTSNIDYKGFDRTHGTFCLSWKGHEFVVFPWQGSGVSEGFSLVFDNVNGVWSTWSRTSDTGTQLPIKSVGTIFYDNATYLMPDPNVDGIGAVQMPRQIKEDVYQDYSSRAINVYWTSPRFNFGTERRKFMSYLSVFFSTGGQDISSGSGTLSMSYYDDHGADLAASRSATLNDSASPNRVVWRRLGSFRERKFLLTHTSNQPLRLKGIEVDLMMAEDDID
jgi:hypothetical protein